MAYEAVEDIPDIESLRVDFRKLNPLMRDVLITTKTALGHRYNFKRTPDDESELLNFLKHQLDIYGSTHNSIHALLRFAIRRKYYGAVADAASLVREQIEKVFIIALVLSDPHRWIKQALRGSFRTDYEEYLLKLNELGDSPRWQKRLREEYPQLFEKLQRHPTSRTRRETIISDYARRVLDYNWNNPRGVNPPWFKPIRRMRVRNVREYLRYYFEFPTPGKAAGYIRSRGLRRFLYRWHKDYSYICQYSHVALGKAILPVMGRSRDLRIIEKTENYSQNLMERIIFTSFTSAASACTLIILKQRDSYGAKSYLIEFWKQLYESSLHSKAIWNIYPKKYLG